jgi:hypothetical protein
LVENLNKHGNNIKGFYRKINSIALRKLLLFIVLFGLQKGNAQFFKNNLYYEGEIGGITSFFYTDANDKSHIITLGGLNFRGGVGIRDGEDIVFFGIYSGMDGNFRHHTGILPVYLNSRIGIPISDSDRIYFSFGYGKSYQIGPENRHGFLRKYTIAYSYRNKGENRESFFMEINNHGFNFPDDNIPVITLNIGYTFTFL